MTFLQRARFASLRTVGRTKAVADVLLRAGLHPGLTQASRTGTSARARKRKPLPALSPLFQAEALDATRKPVEEAMTLPPEHYTSEAIFAHELSTVFRNEWVFAANASELANHGDVYPLTVGDQPLVLCNHKGTVRAFYNVCRHRGAKLVGARCKRTVLLCPYHRWGYALDGRLMATPLWDTGATAPPDGKGRGTQLPETVVQKIALGDQMQHFDKKDWGLLPARLEKWGGMYFVNLTEGGPAEPLESAIGDLAETLKEYPLEELQVARSATVTPKANWKSLVENFLEYYHLPAVHPELCAVSGVDEHCRTQGAGRYVSFATNPLTRGGTAVDPDVAAPFPGLSAESAETAHHVTIFPNVFMSIYPHHAIRVETRPITPSLTEERATLLVHPQIYEDPEAEKKIDAWFKWHLRVNDEDIAIVQAVQEGMQATAYRGGRFSFRFEETVHRYQNMVIDALLK